MHDKNVILWPAKYVSPQKRACLVGTQNQPGVVEYGRMMLENRHRNMCWWTVCRDGLKKEMAGLRAEADKVPGKCPALPV